MNETRGDWCSEVLRQSWASVELEGATVPVEVKVFQQRYVLGVLSADELLDLTGRYLRSRR